MNQNTKKIIVGISIVALIILLNCSSLTDYLSFATFKQNTNFLLKTVNKHYTLATMIYIGLYFFSSVLMLPIIAVLLIAGGFLFGIIPTCIYVNIGCTLGGTISFLMARYFLGKKIQEKYKHKLERFNNNFQKNGTSYLLAVRFIPVLPFFLPNLFAGLTNISVFNFIWTTAVGLVPASIVYAFAGKQLNYITQPSDILSFKILVAFSFLIVLSVVPLVFKNIRNRRKVKS